jgi:uncharacterized protein
MIVDGDGHIAEPLELFEEYVSAEFRDRIFVERDADGLVRRFVWGDVEFKHPRRDDGTFAFGIGDGLTPGGLREGEMKFRPYEEREPGGSYPERRLQMHDEEGIDAAVLYPGFFDMPATWLGDPALALEVCRAYNRWAADFAATSPSELYMVALLPKQHPGLAAQELERCVNEYGFVAGTIRPSPAKDDLPGIGDQSLDPLYAKAVELDVPICFHEFLTRAPSRQAQYGSNSFIVAHSAHHPFQAMLGFGDMYVRGVFERHPALRVAYMESGCGWVPFWLDRLHEHYENVGWLEGVRTDPYEVFARHCVVGTEGEDPMMPYVQGRFGESKVLWSSDIPHFDVARPTTAHTLHRTDMTDDQKTAAMLGAAKELYHLDLDSIAEANRKRRGEDRKEGQ